MTDDGQAGEGMPEPSGGPSAAPADPPSGVMPVGVVLDLCDRLLGEIGRRQHRFAWLRPPGAGIEDCLVCDAYYPGNRMVVICRQDGSEPDALYAAEVPRNGLLLLVLTPTELGLDRLGASETLVAQIGALGPRPERPRGPREIERHHRTPVTSDGAFAAKPRRLESTRAPRPAARAARSAAEPVSERRTATAEHEQRFGMVIGLALVVMLAAESLVLVVLVALGNDHPVLAFGFALDAGARALGTIAAAREGDHGQAWGCVLLGSPGVLRYVLLGPDGAVETEPGPLAGVVSVLAIMISAIGLLGALVGI